MLCLMAAQSTFYPATYPEIHISGRHYIQNNSIKYDWPCFRISFCFNSSTKLSVNLQDTWNIYQVIVDGNLTARVHPKKNVNVTVFQSSQPESHCLDFVKIT
jgi:hypothetical protein